MTIANALYYDLDEVCEILSKKLLTSNLTPQRLIKYIYQFEISTHIFGYGFSITCDFNFASKPTTDNIKYFRRLESVLSGWNFDQGSIFELDQSDVCFFLFQDTVRVCTLKNMVPLIVFGKANNAIEAIQTLGFDLNQFKDLKISNFRPYIDTNYINLNELKSRSVSNMDIKPKLIIDPIYDEDDFIEPVQNIDIEGLLIKLSDLVITQSNLKKLELFLDNPQEFTASSFESNKPKVSQSRQHSGVSQQKVRAKLVAKAFAEHFWQQDTQNLIKIGTMCDKVYWALIDTEYKNELPEKNESIKTWIKDIAPIYAREAGRNKS